MSQEDALDDRQDLDRQDASTQTTSQPAHLSTATCIELVPLLTHVQSDREIRHLSLAGPLPDSSLASKHSLLLFQLLKSFLKNMEIVETNRDILDTNRDIIETNRDMLETLERRDILENMDNENKMQTLVKRLNFSSAPGTSPLNSSTLDKNLKNTIISDIKQELGASDKGDAIKRICSMTSSGGSYVEILYIYYTYTNYLQKTVKTLMP